MSENAAHILQTDKATIKFGGLTAVNELTMDVGRGEIYGLIGPNGAGKTTIFNLLTGVYEPTSGDIRIVGTRVNGLKPYQISRLGVSRTFQNIRLFPSMSVLENVVTACHRHSKQNIIDAVFRLPRYFKDEKVHNDFAMELLEIFGLAKYKDEGGTSLPYGNQRRLEIVRALATRPQLLLLDEPAAGMNAGETTALISAVRQASADYKCGVVVIDHDLRFIMTLCNRIFVLDAGRIIASGPPHVVTKDPKVIEVYIGPTKKNAMQHVQEETAHD